ncbi:MAG: hypothetical protein V4754_07210 [Pseudomonadota bacterium]
MNYGRLSIDAEIAEIEEILRSTSDDDIIKKISFEGRLHSAKNALAALKELPLPQKAKLTFKGKPVVGAHGIFAEFGIKAAWNFVDAFAAVAAGLGENLRFMGPIPDRAKNQLLITGTAIGSFGFEFELPTENDDLIAEESLPERALKNICDLLEKSADGSDDEISELVDEIHPRAVQKIHDFLNHLSQHQAWCGFEYKGGFFQYKDINQLKFSAERLVKENIKENDETILGMFTGILPNDRIFEFTDVASGAVIKGKITAEVSDPDLLLRDYYKKRVTATFGMVQVGHGRPRYRFSSPASIVLTD